MTAIKEKKPQLNIPEATPRRNLPGDLPTVIHPSPSREFPHVQQEPILQLNVQQIAESRRRQAQILDELGFGLPRKMRGVVDSFVGIAVDNETSLFHNGDEKISLADKEQAQDLYHQLRGLIATRGEAYFDEDGIMKKDERDENGRIRTDIKTETGWNNIAGIAPKIAEIMLSKENNIKSVNRAQLLNIFSFAIEVAENPSILERTTISVGFGGSADLATSSRLPAYTLPAELIATQINIFYQDRLNTAVDKVRVKKFQDEQLTKQKNIYGDDIPAIVREHISRIAKGYLDTEKKMEETNGSSLQLLPLLDQDELAEIKKLYAIPEKPLHLRFFSGAEAGIKSNFPDKEDEVRTRREENWDVVKEFASNHFPDLSAHIEYQNDVPWDGHSVEQKAVLEYCAHLLRTSEKQSIQETLTFLEGLGLTKGKENGRELAAEYAGLHVFFFKDRVNLPAAYTNFFDTEHVFEKPDVSIMIGGKSEEMFCGIRDYIAEHASPEGLRDFALLKATRLELEEVTQAKERGDDSEKALKNKGNDFHSEASKLRHMAERLDQWKEAVATRRETYAQPNARIAPSDRPNTHISLISATPIAPYYMGPGDKPYGTDHEAQIEKINQTYYLATESEAIPFAIAAEVHAKGVVKDLQFINKVTK